MIFDMTTSQYAMLVMPYHGLGFTVNWSSGEGAAAIITVRGVGRLQRLQCLAKCSRLCWFWGAL